jgi:2-oxoglutarate ferredoxin oxidoreductase subunit delta
MNVLRKKASAAGIRTRQKTSWDQSVKGYIKIKKNLCKECHLCIHFCPQGHIMPSSEFNAQGYRPVTVNDEKKCNGCAICATMCPDVAIEVYRE